MKLSRIAPPPTIFERSNNGFDGAMILDCSTFESELQSEIAKVALGYDLRFKITYRANTKAKSWEGT